MSNSYTTVVDVRILQRLGNCKDASSFKMTASAAPVLYVAAFGPIKQSQSKSDVDSPDYIPFITTYLTLDILLTGYVALLSKMLKVLDEKCFLPSDYADVSLYLSEEHTLTKLLKTSMPNVYERYSKWKSKDV